MYPSGAPPRFAIHHRSFRAFVVLSVSMSSAPPYLQPYLSAAQLYGAGFNALLWASKRTQAARFDAFMRLVNFPGHSVLDAGCGRADLMNHLLEHNVVPHDYIGLEGVDALAAAA